MTAVTISFLWAVFAPALALIIGYIKGRSDEAKERDQTRAAPGLIDDRPRQSPRRAARKFHLASRP